MIIIYHINIIRGNPAIIAGENPAQEKIDARLSAAGLLRALGKEDAYSLYPQQFLRNLWVRQG